MGGHEHQGVSPLGESCKTEDVSGSCEVSGRSNFARPGQTRIQLQYHYRYYLGVGSLDKTLEQTLSSPARVTFAAVEQAGRRAIMSVAEHYAYRVRWSVEDAAYVGTVAEMASLSWAADDGGGAFAGIQRLAEEVVEEVVEDMTAIGETPPLAIADRTYSGKFMVRVPPEVHRQLALEASEQNVSLNRLAASRLIGA